MNVFDASVQVFSLKWAGHQVAVNWILSLFGNQQSIQGFHVDINRVTVEGDVYTTQNGLQIASYKDVSCIVESCRRRVIIVGDVYNTFANRLSRCYWTHDLSSRCWYDALNTSLWEQLFRLADKNTLFVYFNRWLQEPFYRAEIAQELGEPFADKSFLRTSYVDRWKNYRFDADYCQRVLYNVSLARLNLKTFGFCFQIPF